MAVVAVSLHAAAQPALKVDVGNAGLAKRRAIAEGGFQPEGLKLTPCEGSWPVPYREERHTGAPWAGRFVISTVGVDMWFLVVKSLDKDRPDWRMPITAAHAPGAFSITDLFPLGNVAILLEHPSGQSGPCPRVELNAELRRVTPVQQRGQFGNSDDRWDEGSSQLASFQDGARVSTWAGAVARMEVVSPTGLLVPCTGYFISTNLLMTAAHCVSTDAGAATAVVHLPGGPVTGGRIRLVMAQGLDLDFSILWIDGAAPAATLQLADLNVRPLAVWQASEVPKKVSIVECESFNFAAAEVLHTCDTIGGSSGSPVQDLATGSVIALHVAGCTTSNASSKCRNGATRAGAIRARILQFDAALRAADAAAAAQLVAAGLLP